LLFHLTQLYLRLSHLIASDPIGDDLGTPFSSVCALLIEDKLENGDSVFVLVLSGKHPQTPTSVIFMKGGRDRRAIQDIVRFVVIVAERAVVPRSITGLAHLLKLLLVVDVIHTNLN